MSLRARTSFQTRALLDCRRSLDQCVWEIIKGRWEVHHPSSLPYLPSILSLPISNSLHTVTFDMNTEPETSQTSSAPTYEYKTNVTLNGYETEVYRRAEKADESKMRKPNDYLSLLGSLNTLADTQLVAQIGAKRINDSENSLAKSWYLKFLLDLPDDSIDTGKMEKLKVRRDNHDQYVSIYEPVSEGSDGDLTLEDVKSLLASLKIEVGPLTSYVPAEK